MAVTRSVRSPVSPLPQMQAMQAAAVNQERVRTARRRAAPTSTLVAALRRMAAAIWWIAVLAMPPRFAAVAQCQVPAVIRRQHVS